MRWRLGLLHAFLSVLMLVGAGCVRRYEEPAPDEPHALVKFRVLHHEPLPHTSLSESVRLDGYDIRLPEGLATEPRLRTVRVRPVVHEYRFATEYFHTYTTNRVEMRRESYSCGTYSAPQTCTRTVSRTVTETHRVTDAACETGLIHAPLTGGVYLVQYDFHGAGACAALCYRQLTVPGSSELRLVPCGGSEPPVEATAGGEASGTLPTRLGDAPASASDDEPPPWYRSSSPSPAAEDEAPPYRPGETAPAQTAPAEPAPGDAGSTLSAPGP